MVESFGDDICYIKDLDPSNPEEEILKRGACRRIGHYRG
jgi:hypothetical protein